MKLSIIKLIVIIGLIGLFGPIFVSAQGLRPALRDLNEALDLLVAVKKRDLPESEKDELEISLRQSAFNDIISVSLAEIGGLRKKLRTLADTEDFLKVLAELEKHYQSLRSHINRDITLEEIINIGRQFKIWLEAVSQPQIDEIANFILKNHNQKIIGIAVNRFELIRADLEKIKNVIQPAKWNQLAELLAKAEESIAAAQKLDEKQPALVVDKIKEAYSYFLEMSKLVKK